jgi:hypothetical protein
VVSTCKKARSAHVELLKVERFRMSEGRKGERPKARRPPIMPQGEHVVIYLYISPSTCLSFFSDSPPVFSFLGGLPPSVGGLDFLACWQMLALSGIYRVHATGMKSAQGVEGVYWVMMGGASIGLRVFMNS